MVGRKKRSGSRQFSGEMGQTSPRAEPGAGTERRGHNMAGAASGPGAASPPLGSRLGMEDALPYGELCSSQDNNSFQSSLLPARAVLEGILS